LDPKCSMMFNKHFVYVVDHENIQISSQKNFKVW
jgi:hypothetical protein